MALLCKQVILTPAHLSSNPVQPRPPVENPLEQVVMKLNENLVNVYLWGSGKKRGLDEYHRFDLGAGQMRAVRK